MGIDATIHFKTELTTEELEKQLSLESYISVCEIHENFSEEGETHEIDTPFRLYDEHYERGDWGGICEILMELIQHPKIEKVWYGGDCGSPTECDSERVLRISKFYMEHGCRPYRDKAYRKGNWDNY